MPQREILREHEADQSIRQQGEVGLGTEIRPGQLVGVLAGVAVAGGPDNLVPGDVGGQVELELRGLPPAVDGGGDDEGLGPDGVVPTPVGVRAELRSEGDRGSDGGPLRGDFGLSSGEEEDERHQGMRHILPEDRNRESQG